MLNMLLATVVQLKMPTVRGITAVIGNRTPFFIV